MDDWLGIFQVVKSKDGYLHVWKKRNKESIAYHELGGLMAGELPPVLDKNCKAWKKNDAHARAIDGLLRMKKISNMPSSPLRKLAESRKFFMVTIRIIKKVLTYVDCVC